MIYFPNRVLRFYRFGIRTGSVSYESNCDNPWLKSCVGYSAFSVRNKLLLTSWKWKLPELTFECFWLVQVIKADKIHFPKICYSGILLWIQLEANNKNPMYHMARNWNPSFFILKITVQCFNRESRNQEAQSYCSLLKLLAELYTEHFRTHSELNSHLCQLTPIHKIAFERLFSIITSMLQLTLTFLNVFMSLSHI